MYVINHFYNIILENDVSEVPETKFDVKITIMTMILNYISTLINQTTTIHLYIFIIIVGSFILLISVVIITLCYKLLSNRFLYTSAQTQVC